MAINIDNNKLSLFHSFSKTPVSANISLGNAINKSGHTVSSTEVWGEEIPFFGQQANADGIHKNLSNGSSYGDMCKYVDDAGVTRYWRRNQTPYTASATMTQLWQEVTDQWGDGFELFNRHGDVVIKYHEDKFIENLNDDNNANTNSEDCAARLWLYEDVEGSTTKKGRLIEQFVGPTDKSVNGIASVAYAPVVKQVGVAKPFDDGSEYSMVCYSGTILWNTDRTNTVTPVGDGSITSQYTVSCFEYVGKKVSAVIADIKSEIGEIETAAGAGINVGVNTEAKVTGVKNITIKGDKSAVVSKTASGDAIDITVSVDTSNLATKDEVTQQVAGAKVSLSSDKATGKTGITIDKDGQESKTFTIGIDQNVIATKKSVDDLSGVVDGISSKLSTLESLPKFKVQIVSAVPETLTDDMENTIFLVEDTTAPGTYVEHLVFKSGETLVSEKIGTTSTDLSGYVKNVVVKTTYSDGESEKEFEGTLGADGSLTINIPFAESGNGPGLASLYNRVANDNLSAVYENQEVNSGATVQAVFDYGQAILNKTVDKTTYAADKLALEGSIDGKVDTATYNAKIGEIDGTLANVATKTDLTGYVSNTDKSYVKSITVNGGTPKTTTDNDIDLTVITGVHSDSSTGMGLALSVKDGQILAEAAAAGEGTYGTVQTVSTIVDEDNHVYTASATVPTADAVYDFVTSKVGAIDTGIMGVELLSFSPSSDKISIGYDGQPAHVGQSGHSPHGNLLAGKMVRVDGNKVKLYDTFIGYSYIASNGTAMRLDSLIHDAGVKESLGVNSFYKVIGNVIYDENGKVLTEIDGTRFIETGQDFDTNVSHNIREWYCDLPNLINGSGMFYGNTNFTTFVGDLSSLKEGGVMFYGCSALETFLGDLSSLENGDKMFGTTSSYTNLSVDSVQCICDTLPDRTRVGQSPSSTGFISIYWAADGDKMQDATFKSAVAELFVKLATEKNWTISTNAAIGSMSGSEFVPAVTAADGTTQYYIYVRKQEVTDENAPYEYTSADGKKWNVHTSECLIGPIPTGWEVHPSKEAAIAAWNLTAV